MRPAIKSFYLKVSIALIFSMFLAGTLSNLLIYKFTLDSHFRQLGERLKVIATTAALMIDPEALSRVPLTREGINSAEFKSIAGILRKIRDANPPIKYIYIMAMSSKAGYLQFVVDADIPSEAEILRGTTFFPGDHYDATRFPEMLKAFEAPSADKKLGRDEWGTVLSGYAPIRDSSYRTVAILGVDMAAEDVGLTQREVHLRAIIVFLLGSLASLGVGLFVSTGITRPVRKLVEGTRRISDGDFHYRIKVHSGDEIGQLTRSFNRMTHSLYISKKKLHEYFYNIMKSFVRIMEAKDKYIRGHSERVAEYAEKIAIKMSFSPEKIQLLKNAALLHDIGKLVIEESILNKEGPLTPQEWEIIRRHPVSAEEIIRPVALDSQLLSIIRSHHERYDSKGYPDGIDEDKKHIFASIISVADAFDAMTTSRVYREKPLTRGQAIEELRKHSGTQFNPDIVNVFVELLTQEA